MFGFIKQKLKKIYNQFTSKAATLFSRTTVDENTLKELEVLLLSSDTGVASTRSIMHELKERAHSGRITDGNELKEALQEQLNTRVASLDEPYAHRVYLLVGINGSGKTTFAGKLAHHFATRGEKVLLVAADTFRAAATEQLSEWAQRTTTAIEQGAPDQDPASVVYKACERFNAEQFDRIIIDTAGRLQTKTNLMKELEKIKRIITKQLPQEPICTLLTIDAMLGQNSFDQAQLFHEATDVSGIVLTKFDGTGKGGIVFAIYEHLKLPVAFISCGEQLENMYPFNAPDYVTELLNS